MKRELAILISQDLNDKRINTVTITSVTVSKDLRQSKVFFSSIKDEDKTETVEKLLNNSAGFLRHQLGKTLELRILPTIEFKFDSSLKRGVEMSTLIDRLNSNNGE